MKQKVLFSIVLVIFICTSSFAYELILRNDDPLVCTVVGDWLTTSTNAYNASKFYIGPGTGAGTVTYHTTDIPAGWYKVDFRVNSNTDYTTSARYTVTHRDGVENIVVSQRKSSSNWYVLGGAFYFDGTATVVLSDQFTTAEGNWVIADEIRFHSVFSFIQMTDTHAGYGPGNTQGTLVANELKTLGRVQMATYGFFSPPPSFAIHCGDITEYGKEYWSTQQTMFSGMPFPIYRTIGNHDSTWNSCKEALKSEHGSAHYSFDFTYQGTKHHFISLDSTVLQSPRAAFSREQLDWLAADLAAQSSTTPIYVFFHHPLDGTSDPKHYDTYKFIDMLKSKLYVSCFYGHGHSAVKRTVDQVTLIQGGSTYSDSVGVGCYNIVSIVHNRIYIAKKVYGEATAATGLHNVAIPTATPYPSVSISSPAKNTVVGSTLTVTTSKSGSGTVTACDVELNDSGTWVSLTGSGNGPYTGTIDMTGMIHGRHWLRVRFTMETGGPYYKSVDFWHWDGFPKPKYIVDLGATGLGAPVIDNGKVYVGTHGGTFRCVDAKYGAEIWKVNTPSDVMSTPEVADGKVIFGCGDGYVYCLNAETGVEIWKKELSGPVYSSPRVDNGNVYIGCNGTGAANSAYLYSLRLSDGYQNWRYAVGNAIEAKPFVLNGVAYIGAWDSYLYAINTADGSLKWRYQRTASRYESPADSWPVASLNSNKVYAADRGYQLNAVNMNNGLGAWTRSGVSAQNLNKDHSALLIRNSASPGNLDKIDWENTYKYWDSPCVLDSAPVAPMYCGEKIAIVEQQGMASVLSDSTGTIDFQFQIACGYELSPVNVDYEGNLYASTYDGYLLCVTNSEPPAQPVPDILLETRDAAGNLVPNPPYKEYVTGNTWANSTEKTAVMGLVGLGSRYNTLSGGLLGKASMSPNIITPGDYNVYVTWGRAGNANNVSYYVNHKDGTTTITLDQKPLGANSGSNANTWVKLGKFSFNTGQDEAAASVTVDESTVTGPNNPSYSTGRVYADAFLFSYVPEFTPTPTPPPTSTPTPSPSPTATPTPTPGAPAVRLNIEDFQSYTSDTSLRTVWAGSTNSTLAYYKSSGGADSTTNWMELTDGGWGMNILASYPSAIPSTGGYKCSFYYKNGHVNNPQGSLVVTFKDGSGNTKATFNIPSMAQTTWEYLEASTFATFNANDTVRIEITGSFSGTLSQACGFDQFSLIYENPPATPTPLFTPTPPPSEVNDWNLIRK